MMQIKLINMGFGNMVSANRILPLSVESAPIKGHNETRTAAC